MRASSIRVHATLQSRNDASHGKGADEPSCSWPHSSSPFAWPSLKAANAARHQQKTKPDDPRPSRRGSANPGEAEMRRQRNQVQNQ